MMYGTFFNQLTFAAELGEGRNTEEIMLRLAQSGLSATDIDSYSVSEMGADYIRKLHKDAGLSVASMFHVVKLDYKNPDVLKLMKEDNKIQAEACAKAGSPLLMAVPTASASHESIDARNEALKIAAAYISDLAEEAKQYGVTVVVENYSGINTPLAYISDIEYILNNVPGAGYVFDSGNFWFGGTDMMEACRRFADRTVHVHLKDLDDKDTGLTVNGKTCRSVAIGDGILPIYDAVNYLNSEGYTGVYTIEINHNKDMLPAILKSLDNLNYIFSKEESPNAYCVNRQSE